MAPLLGPETISWRVNREPLVLAGGGAALLLQVAHPLVAAGVTQHSDYERDPWGRLYRTLDMTIKIVFGERDLSERTAARLRGRHVRVRGTSDAGEPYDARDPALLIWVWATLVHTALGLYERCLGPLTAHERDRYLAEQHLFAYACGVPEGACPDTWEAFRRYWARTVADDLQVTPGARAVARTIATPRGPAPLQPLLNGLALPNTALTTGLLPPGLRSDYGLPWSARDERVLAATLGALSAGSRVVPRPIRELPMAAVASGRLDGLAARAMSR